MDQLVIYVCTWDRTFLYSSDSEQQVPQLRDFSGEDVAVSKNALIHAFIKLRAPSHCRECDEYVYFNGYECETVS